MNRASAQQPNTDISKQQQISLVERDLSSWMHQLSQSSKCPPETSGPRRQRSQTIHRIKEALADPDGRDSSSSTFIASQSTDVSFNRPNVTVVPLNDLEGNLPVAQVPDQDGAATVHEAQVFEPPEPQPVYEAHEMTNIKGHPYRTVGIVVAMLVTVMAAVLLGHQFWGNASASPPRVVVTANETRLTQKGASLYGTQADGYLGTSVSISSNGSVVAIGSPLADGILHDDQTRIRNAGTVQVYSWKKDSYYPLGNAISGSSEYDTIAHWSRMALSGDGSTVVVASRAHNFSTGQVRMFQYHDGHWIQRGSDLVGVTRNQQFGFVVKVSEDGDTVLVHSCPLNATCWIEMYRWNSTTSDYSKLGEDIFVNETEVGAGNKVTVSLSLTGNRLVIGANSAGLGKAYVFDWDGIHWEQVGLLNYGRMARNQELSVACSSQCDTIAVGTTGRVNVYTFSKSKEWERKGDTLQTDRGLGFPLSISDDGNRVALGTQSVDEKTVYVYGWENNDWDTIGVSFPRQRISSYPNVLFFELSGDGTTLVVGEPSQDGIDQATNSTLQAAGKVVFYAV